MPSSPQWAFGPFRLDPDHACLWCEGQAVVLPPKVFAVLSYLVTHPNRLVAKDELLDAVWPETAVSDAVVRIAIGALRKVLGDTAQMPRYIATVSRRGYHFLAPVVEYPGVAPDPVEPMPPAALQTPTREPPATPDTPHCVDVAPLPGVLRPLDAERRYLTVLFCDLVD